MTAALITPPAVEPVTLIEAKAHLRLDHEDDDDLVSALLAAARMHIEALTRRVMIEQVWRVYRDGWPAGGTLTLPLGPVTAVTAVVVYAADGTPTTLPPSAYMLDLASVPARLSLRAAMANAPGRALNGIEIDITVGFSRCRSRCARR
jgi:uncharacterized phiE125 gp8 family phage protein